MSSAETTVFHIRLASHSSASITTADAVRPTTKSVGSKLLRKKKSYNVGFSDASRVQIDLPAAQLSNKVHYAKQDTERTATTRSTVSGRAPMYRAWRNLRWIALEDEGDFSDQIDALRTVIELLEVRLPPSIGRWPGPLVNLTASEDAAIEWRFPEGTGFLGVMDRAAEAWSLSTVRSGSCSTVRGLTPEELVESLILGIRERERALDP